MVEKKIKLLSNAKFNPYLFVGQKRMDGYHNLSLGFQYLTLADEMSFTLTQNKIIFDYELPFKRSDDLCFKAVNFLTETKEYKQKKSLNKKVGICIKLKKNIPFGSGLGGGSSNAATTLLALNQIWDLQLKQKKLIEIGLNLGADVPFFIYGKSAKALGIGEKLTAFNFSQKSYLLIYPQIAVSTKQVFNHLSLIKRKSFPLVENEIDFSNDCLDIAFLIHPKLKMIYDFLSTFGKVSMSGTGSSFLLDVDQKADEQIASLMSQIKASKICESSMLCIVKSLNISPLHIKLSLF